MINVFFGKFLPFHNGHAFITDFMLATNHNCFIIVYAKPTEEYSLIQRISWIKETYKSFIDTKQLTVLGFYTDLPDPENLLERKIWADYIRKCIYGTKEHIRFFGGEDYINELALADGNASAVVKNRNTAWTFQYSGTAIRKNIVSKFHYTVKKARPDLIKKIALIGTESSGKSTLAEKLAEKLQCSYVQEFGRDYCVGPISSFTLKDLEYIAYEQIELEKEVARDSNSGILVCDTDITVTRAWANHLFGTTSNYLDYLQETSKYDVYFILDGLDWVNDGTRIISQPQDRVKFKNFLIENTKHKVHSLVTHQSIDQRVNYCYGVIKNLFEL